MLPEISQVVGSKISRLDETKNEAHHHNYASIITREMQVKQKVGSKQTFLVLGVKFVNSD